MLRSRGRPMKMSSTSSSHHDNRLLFILGDPSSNGDDENHNDVLYLHLEFSLWQQQFDNTPNTTMNILGILRDFFCWGMSPGEFSVVSALDPNEKNLCFTQTANASSTSLNVTAPIETNVGSGDGVDITTKNETIVAFERVVSTKEEEESRELAWLKFKVTYQVVQLSSAYNSFEIITTGDFFLTTALLHPELQLAVQQGLDRTIQRGDLDEYLWDYFDHGESSSVIPPKFSVVGDEVETFMGHAISEEEYEFYQEAMILRQIGTGLLAAMVWFVLVVTLLARHRRVNRLQLVQYKKESNLRRESKQKHQSQRLLRESDHAIVTTAQSTEVVCLETEQDANHMLALGKAESIKAMQGSSIFLKTSSKEDPSL